MHAPSSILPFAIASIPPGPTVATKEQTFLTHPEWYIGYSSDEYADWLSHRLPTEFPYARSIGQFWIDYREALPQTRNAYPFNTGYHIMLGVIGVSYSAELALKGVYENTIGQYQGWTASDVDRRRSLRGDRSHRLRSVHSHSSMV